VVDARIGRFDKTRDDTLALGRVSSPFALGRVGRRGNYRDCEYKNK
jgi:hypothetical protein